MPAGVSLNLNVRGLPHSPTLAIQAKVRALRAEGRHIHNLGLGESPFPVPRSVVERLQEYAARKEYLPVAGLPELQEAVVSHLRREQGIASAPERILVGPGSKELLFLLQLCFYGDIVVPSPCWVSYMPQAHILGRQVSVVPTRRENDWKVTPEDFAATMDEAQDKTRPRLFVLNYPANPTGVTYTADELQALAKVAREYGALVLSDEIYGGLHFDGNHVSIARYYPEGTIILNGISKWAGAGGWRLGVFSFPEELAWLRTAMSAVASETYTSVSTPIQFAAVKAFEGGLRIERYLNHVRRILKDVAHQTRDRLTDAGLHVAKPGGGFYLFPDASDMRTELGKRGIRTGKDLATRLLEETGVAALPGASFARPRDELSLRLSLVDFDGNRALAKSEMVPLDQPLSDDFAAQYCTGVLEAADKMAAWMRGDVRAKA